MKSRLVGAVFKALLLAALGVYIIVRVGDNTFSWKEPKTSKPSHSTAVQAGDQYASLLAGTQPADQKIRALWNLCSQPDWSLPAWSGDPLPLAQEIARRARAYAQAGNLPQAASHNKILLQWAACLLHATGPGTGTSRSLQVADTAINSVAASPQTLRYPAIQALLEALSKILSSSNTQVDNLIDELRTSEKADGPKNLLILANRKVLRNDLTDYLSTTRSPKEAKIFVTRMTARAWLLVSPLTPRLFHQAVARLESGHQAAKSQREAIAALLGNDPATIMLPE